MNLKVGDAVSRAISHVEELYSKEGITNVGLEEVEFDDAAGEWTVTVGFSRPWEQLPRGNGGLAAVLDARTLPKRTYKQVRIDDGSAEGVAVRNRRIDA